MLKPVNNDTAGRGYCGPTAIAAITGQPLSEVLNAARCVWYGYGWPDKFDRSPPVKGMSNGSLERTMGLFGYAGNWIKVRDKPTLARWFKTREKLMRDTMVVVNVTGHYVTVKGNKFLDTMTKGQWVNIGDAPGRRKRVKAVFVPVKMSAGLKDIPSMDKKRKQLARETTSLKAAIKKAGGGTLSIDGDIATIELGDVTWETMHYSMAETQRRFEEWCRDPEDFRADYSDDDGEYECRHVWWSE